MKTQVFKTNNIIAELQAKIAGDKNDETERAQAKLDVVKEYPNLEIKVRKFSAKQKDVLEQTLMNPTMRQQGNRVITQNNLDVAAFKKKAVQFGIIDIQPRILDMVKVRDAAGNDPEIWQIKDEVMDGDLDWDFRDILLGLIDEVNPKNWI